ncbi:MAG: hypothetical protein ACRESE_07515 [Gammaproteobacteria bacterium]
MQRTERLQETRKMRFEEALTGVPHSFQSSFRDWAAERTNTPSAVMETAHAGHDKTVAAYARSDLFERRTKLMDKWQQHCMAAKAESVPIGLRQA